MQALRPKWPLAYLSLYTLSPSERGNGQLVQSCSQSKKCPYFSFLEAATMGEGRNMPKFNIPCSRTLFLKDKDNPLLARKGFPSLREK